MEILAKYLAPEVFYLLVWQQCEMWIPVLQRSLAVASFSFVDRSLTEKRGDKQRALSLPSELDDSEDQDPGARRPELQKQK